jgi:hypothetical protein
MSAIEKSLTKEIIIVRTVIFGFIVMLFLLSSCKHSYNKDNFIGSEYASAPKGFHLVNSFTATPAAVNFTTQKVAMTAEFSDRVTWKVTITGRQSKAVKYLEGLSKELDGLNALWDGSSSNNRFFKAGENCDLVLTFLGTEISFSQVVKITTTKNYDGVLISDFDGGGIVNNFSWWYGYSDTVQPAKIPEIYSYGIKTGPLTPIQGNSYLNQSGEDLDQDWYIGGLGFWYDVDLNDKLTALSNDPSEIYLNAFVNVNGNQNTALSFAVFEGGTTRDIFSKVIQVKSTEWELVSMKLSTFTRNPTSNGNGVLELSKLKTMEIVPAPSVIGAKCEMNVDFIIFTKGEPFKP